MAKRFAGFTPEQLGRIDPSLKGMQSDEQEKIIAANPALAARVGKMTQMAQKRIGMAEGGFVDLESRLSAQRRGFSGAGQVPPQQFLVQDPFQRPYGITPRPGSDYLADALRPTIGQLPTTMPVKENFAAAIPPHSHGGGGEILPSGNIAGGNNPAPNQQPQDLKSVFEKQKELDMGFAQIDMEAQTKKDALQEALTMRYGFAVGGVVGGNAAEIAVAAADLKRKQDAEDEEKKKKDEEASTDPVDDKEDKPDPMSEAGKAAAELTKTALESPETLVKDTEVKETTEEQKEAGEIAEGTGEAATVDEAAATVATPAAAVTAPVKTPAATVLPETVSAEVSDTLKKLEAATGKPSSDALAEAATMSPEKLKSLGLTVEQIEQARRVEGAPTRKVEAGEMIEGSTVDMERVKKEVNFEAATGAPSTDATVQGQLTGLMEDFEGAAPPAWAAGAMRAAAARMASRGLSSSSMAGQAIVQAAMESAIPIASQDAKTVASFEMQNLSNRQQTAMFAAQQRAQFLGLEFNQEFQARVTNAAKISDIANMNFSAEQQIALENARMAQTVDITNLNAKNAKIMADAAAMSQVDMANLNNRQQANIQAANAFLQMDMANLSNEQQTTMFAAQAQINAMLSDQAAENAARQFNASSENQVNQFFADLGARVQLANADQANAMSRFNAGEANALAQFNTAQANQREQFNATNRLVVAQANAQWAQAYTTADNAAINEANRLDAQRQGQMTLNAYNATIQTYRDLMSFANTTANNDADRATSIMVAKIQADAAKYGADKAAQAAASSAAAEKTSGFWSAVGAWAGSAFG
jgi:hypothetical protein